MSEGAVRSTEAPTPTQQDRRSDSDVPEPPLYALFGKFRLIARLGKGGMGEVFLAVVSGFKGVNKLVVVKRLRESYGDDQQMRVLFLEEGRLATRLNHPNVVQTIEVGEESGALYLGMEYLEGQSLNELRRKLGTANVERHVVARIISDALTGLHYAHELCDYDGSPLNIVHRDLSPHNIFITYDGVVKLLDFGIAKATIQSDHTDPGVFKGKISYMAPEQVVANTFDRRADIFVLGIVLWELLAGRRLFATDAKGQSMGQGIDRLLKMPIPRLASIVPDIPPELQDIVDRALERRLEKRYATAKEMRDALEVYIAKSGKLARPEDLGQLMNRLFAHRRGRVRERIREYMRAAETVHSTTDLPLLVPIRKDGDTGVGSSVSSLSNAIPQAAPSMVRTTPSRPKSDTVLAALVIVLVLAGSLAAGVLTRPRPVPSPVATATPTPTTIEPERRPVADVHPIAEAVATASAGAPGSSVDGLPPAAASSKASTRARAGEARPAAMAAAPESAHPRPAATVTAEERTPKPEEPAADTAPSASKRKFRTTF